MAKLDSDQRIAQLAAIAEELKHLSVHTQLRVLGAAGMTLKDINWENCVSDPHLLTAWIPTAVAGPSQKQKA